MKESFWVRWGCALLTLCSMALIMFLSWAVATILDWWVR